MLYSLGTWKSLPNQDPYQRIAQEGIDQKTNPVGLNQEAGMSQPNTLGHIPRKQKKASTNKKQ